MLPYILAAIGGYLIGDSMKGKTVFADGGDIKYHLDYDIFNRLYIATLLGGEFDNTYGHGKTEENAVSSLKLRIIQLRNKRDKTFASGGVIDNELIDKHGGLDDIVSDCCGSKIVNEDICKGCKEHCGRVYVFKDGFSCDEDGVDVENSRIRRH